MMKSTKSLASSFSGACARREPELAALAFQLRRLLRPDLLHLSAPTSPKVLPPPAEWLSHLPFTSSWSIPATACWRSEPSNCDAANRENGALATTALEDSAAVAETGCSQLRTNLRQLRMRTASAASSSGEANIAKEDQLSSVHWRRLTIWKNPQPPTNVTACSGMRLDYRVLTESLYTNKQG